MDFATFMSRVGQYVSNSDNAYFIVYAIATCLLTQLLKKLFVNKAKVDVLGKFDFATILPFIVGLGFAALDIFLVKGIRTFSFSIAMRIVVSTLSIGALSSTMFKLVKFISGQSLSSLMKNDVFGIFYTQLLYFGNIRQQLADKTITFEQFVEQVKLISANAESIYATEDSVEVKRRQLARLLGGIIDEKSIDACLNALNEALIKFTTK